jgi:hypothetical protein
LNTSGVSCREVFPHLYNTIVRAVDAVIDSFELEYVLPKQWWSYPIRFGLAELDEEQHQPLVKDSAQWVLQVCHMW